jgi:hypothetical protein
VAHLRPPLGVSKAAESRGGHRRNVTGVITKTDVAEIGGVFGGASPLFVCTDFDKRMENLN